MPTLAILDTAPERGVYVAASLARAHIAHPVLQLGRWPYRAAILPAAALVDALLLGARDLPDSLSSRHAVLVLDGERNRPLRGRPARDGRADNRYELAMEELPDATSLRGVGVERVIVWSREGRGSQGIAAAYAAHTAAAIPVVHRVVPGNGAPS